ncbi:MAG: tripartite tricarboxylate transporter substrate binding protein [Burkholderiales bacterium]
MKIKCYVEFLSAAIACGGWTGAAIAQAYPVKPVRIVVPYAAGGPYDDIARTLGQRLTEIWGQPVIVENRGGAGGNIGADVVAKAAPDGYTTLLGNAGPITVNPTLFKKLPYDPQRDLAPVGMINASRMVLSVHPSLPAKTVKDLVALAKAAPGKLSFASSGVGNLQHLGMELLQIQAGVKMNHIPYKGAAPAFVDLISGQVDSMFANIVGTMPHVRTGRVRAMAVSSASRSPLLPDVPSVGETFKGFDIPTWSGIFAPAATPRDILAKLNGDLQKVLQRADVKERFANQGSEATPSSAETLAEHVRKETLMYAHVIRTAKISAE